MSSIVLVHRVPLSRTVLGSLVRAHTDAVSDAPSKEEHHDIHGTPGKLKGQSTARRQEGTLD